MVLMMPVGCCDKRSNRKPSVAFTPALVRFSIVTHKCQLVWSEVNSHDRQEKRSWQSKVMISTRLLQLPPPGETAEGFEMWCRAPGYRGSMTKNMLTFKIPGLPPNHLAYYHSDKSTHMHREEKGMVEHQKCRKRAETLVNQPNDSRTVVKGACHCLAHLTVDIKEKASQKDRA